MKKKAPKRRSHKRRDHLQSDLPPIEEAKFNCFTDFLLQTLVKRRAKNKGIYRFVEDTIEDTI